MAWWRIAKQDVLVGISCKIINVVRFVTVRNWKTFCDLSVNAGHYVTRGYFGLKSYHQIVQDPFELIYPSWRRQRFSETSEHQTAAWWWYAKERHYMINHLHENVKTYKMAVEIRIMILSFWHRNYFFNFSTPVYTMWIIQEPNTLELWNKLHFEEEKNGEYITCLKYSVSIFVE